MSVGHAALAKAIFFLSSIGLHWILIPLWAWSTCRHSSSLHVRVRSCKWLITDLMQILILITSLGIKEVLLVFGYRLPCPMTTALAALAFVSLPGMLLWRTLHLWYAFKLMEGKDVCIVSLRFFSALLAAFLLTVAFLSLLIATSGRRLCLTDMCTVQCYWSSQYVLLIPLTLLMAAAQLLSFRLLASTQKVERLGLVIELKRVLQAAAPLTITGHVIVVLMDVGVMDLQGHGHTIISLLYTLVYSSRFITLHVLPSIAYGYYPRRNLLHCLKPSKVLPHVPMPKLTPLRDFSLSFMGDSSVVASAAMRNRGFNNEPLLDQLHPPPTIVSMKLTLVQQSDTSISSSSSSYADFAISTQLSWELSELLNPYNPQYGAFLAFCQSLLCDHYVQFLMATKLLVWQGTGATADQLVAVGSLHDLYTTYLSPGAPRAVALNPEIRRALRRRFEPERRSSVGRGVADFYSNFVRMSTPEVRDSRCTNELDGEEGSPEDNVLELLRVSLSERDPKGKFRIFVAVILAAGVGAMVAGLRHVETLLARDAL